MLLLPSVKFVCLYLTYRLSCVLKVIKLDVQTIPVFVDLVTFNKWHLSHMTIQVPLQYFINTTLTMLTVKQFYLKQFSNPSIKSTSTVQLQCNVASAHEWLSWFLCVPLQLDTQLHNSAQVSHKHLQKVLTSVCIIFYITALVKAVTAHKGKHKLLFTSKKCM